MMLLSTKILVVDDNPDVRATTVRMLQVMGLRDIAQAEDGDEAFTKLAVGEFGLIVSDWDMPRMTGFDLLKKVRSHSELRVSRLPFILMTAGDPYRRYLASDANVTGFLLKPFLLDLFKETVQKALT